MSDMSGIPVLLSSFDNMRSYFQVRSLDSSGRDSSTGRPRCLALAIIGTNPETLGSIVNIYDCKEISEPKLVKQFTLSARYFTARISNGKLYVLAKHYLSSDNFSKNLAYSDDAAPLAIAYHQLHYLPDSPTKVADRKSVV